MRHITTPGFLVGLSIVILICGFVGMFYMADFSAVKNVPPKLKDWVALPVAGTAIAGFLFNSGIKFHSELRDRAFRLFLSGDSSAVFQDHFRIVLVFFNDHRGKDLKTEQLEYIIAAHTTLAADEDPEKGDKTPFNDTSLAARLKVALLGVANNFEEMAIAIYEKEVNEPLLREFYVQMFLQFYSEFKFFLPVIRNINNKFTFDALNYSGVERPAAFRQLDWLYDRWSHQYRKMTAAARRGWTTGFD